MIVGLSGGFEEELTPFLEHGADLVVSKPLDTKKQNSLVTHVNAQGYTHDPEVKYVFEGDSIKQKILASSRSRSSSPLRSNTPTTSLTTSATNSLRSPGIESGRQSPASFLLPFSPQPSSRPGHQQQPQPSPPSNSTSGKFEKESSSKKTSFLNNFLGGFTTAGGGGNSGKFGTNGSVASSKFSDNSSSPRKVSSKDSLQEYNYMNALSLPLSNMNSGKSSGSPSHKFQLPSARSVRNNQKTSFPLIGPTGSVLGLTNNNNTSLIDPRERLPDIEEAIVEPPVLTPREVFQSPSGFLSIDHVVVRHLEGDKDSRGSSFIGTDKLQLYNQSQPAVSGSNSNRSDNIDCLSQDDDIESANLILTVSVDSDLDFGLDSNSTAKLT